MTNKNLVKSKALFDLMRPVNSFLTVVAVIVGVLTTGGSVSTEVFFASISVFLVVSGGFSINDYYDRKVDAINDPQRPIPSGLVSPIDAKSFGYLLLSAGVIVAMITLSPLAVLIASTSALLLDLYSRVLKPKQAIVGNLVTSYSTAVTYVFGWAASGGTRPNAFLTLAFMFSITLLASWGREFIKAIDDVRGDRQCGIKTAAVQFGVKGAAWLGTIFVLSAAVVSPIPWLLGVFGDFYMMGFLLVDGIAIAACVWLLRKIHRRLPEEALMRYAKYSKNFLLVAMGVGIIAFTFGAKLYTIRR